MKKMKIIINVSVILICSFCYAQQDPGTYKTNFKWEVSVAYNSVDAQINQALINSWYFPYNDFYGYFGNKKDKSFSFSVIPSMRISDNLKLRIELGNTSIKLEKQYNGVNDSNSFGANTKANNRISQNIYRFALGIETQLISKKKVHAFCGVGIYMNYYKKMKWHVFVELNDTPGRATEYDSQTIGGFAVGPGMFSGLKFQITDCFALSAEFCSVLMYYHVGGAQEGTITNYYPNYPTETTFFSMNDNLSDGFQFFKPMPSFKMAFQF